MARTEDTDNRDSAAIGEVYETQPHGFALLYHLLWRHKVISVPIIGLLTLIAFLMTPGEKDKSSTDDGNQTAQQVPSPGPPPKTHVAPGAHREPVVPVTTVGIAAIQPLQQAAYELDFVRAEHLRELRSNVKAVVAHRMSVGELYRRNKKMLEGISLPQDLDPRPHLAKIYEELRVGERLLRAREQSPDPYEHDPEAETIITDSANGLEQLAEKLYKATGCQPPRYDGLEVPLGLKMVGTMEALHDRFHGRVLNLPDIASITDFTADMTKLTEDCCDDERQLSTLYSLNSVEFRKTVGDADAKISEFIEDMRKAMALTNRLSELTDDPNAKRHLMDIVDSTDRRIRTLEALRMPGGFQEANEIQISAIERPTWPADVVVVFARK